MYFGLCTVHFRAYSEHQFLPPFIPLSRPPSLPPYIALTFGSWGHCALSLGGVERLECYSQI